MKQNLFYSPNYFRYTEFQELPRLHSCFHEIFTTVLFSGTHVCKLKKPLLNNGHIWSTYMLATLRIVYVQSNTIHISIYLFGMFTMHFNFTRNKIILWILCCDKIRLSVIKSIVNPLCFIGFDHPTVFCQLIILKNWFIPYS